MAREDWEAYEALREERKQKRRDRLEVADTTGWKELSYTHFRMELSPTTFVDWWPSANKWAFFEKGKETKYFRGSCPGWLRREITDAKERL